MTLTRRRSVVRPGLALPVTVGNGRLPVTDSPTAGGVRRPRPASLVRLWVSVCSSQPGMPCLISGHGLGHGHGRRDSSQHGVAAAWVSPGPLGIPSQVRCQRGRASSCQPDFLGSPKSTRALSLVPEIRSIWKVGMCYIHLRCCQCSQTVVVTY